MIKSVEFLLETSGVAYEYEVHESGNPYAFYFEQTFQPGVMRGVIGVHYRDGLVYIFRYFPMAFPERRRSALFDYLTHVNRRSRYGTFQLDPEDLTLGADATFSMGADDDINQKQLNTIFSSITDGLIKCFEGALKVGIEDKDPVLVWVKQELNYEMRYN